MGNNVSHFTVWNCASNIDIMKYFPYNGHDTIYGMSVITIENGLSAYGESSSLHCECDDCWYCQLDFEIFSKRGGCITEFNYWLDNVPHNNHVVITNDDTTNGYNLELYDTFSSCEALLLN